jgi:hypothetical protein
MHFWKLGLLMSWARPLLACANDAVIINVHAASSMVRARAV